MQALSMSFYIPATRGTVGVVFTADDKNQRPTFKVNLNLELNVDFMSICSLSLRSREVTPSSGIVSSRTSLLRNSSAESRSRTLSVPVEVTNKAVPLIRDKGSRERTGEGMWAHREQRGFRLYSAIRNRV